MSSEEHKNGGPLAMQSRPLTPYITYGIYMISVKVASKL
jgi:hypothetical protein